MKEYHKIADRLYLESIAPQQLDKFLAMGWYRMGQTIFTTHFLFYEKDIYSAIWLRLLLEDYMPSKSLRKILRKNRKLFRCEVVPFNLTEEKKVIYAAYAKEFKGHLAESLESSLLEHETHNIYDTLEINIYDGDRLIAFSFFDNGDNSIASITGIYDPEYYEYSLGVYTMLEEVEYAKHCDKKFFYPGYFVPGNSRFDYKLRLNNMSYLDITGRKWKPINDFLEPPINKIREKLVELKQELSSKVKSVIKQNPYLEAHLIEFWPFPYLEEPMILIPKLPFEQQKLIDQINIFIYNIEHGRYQYLLCDITTDSPSNYNKEWISKLSSRQFYKKQLLHNKLIYEGETIEEIIAFIETC